jgi:hypothetical protein
MHIFTRDFFHVRRNRTVREPAWRVVYREDREEGSRQYIREVPAGPRSGTDPDTQEKTGEEMGKEIYREVPVGDKENKIPKGEKKRKLLLVQLVRTRVVQGFLQDLDIGDVMLAQ